MARRKQSSFEDIIEITAKLPWWVGIVLAIVFYIVLHSGATMDIATPTDLKQFGDSAGKQIYKTLATFLQYILPVTFLAGSVVSALARRKRTALYAKAATTNDALAQMTWQDFELFVGEFFRRRGFSVKEIGGGGADGGVDLILSSGKDCYVVQCKKWKSMQVGVATVRELYGVMTAMGAVGGFVVTSGAFTEDARRFAEGREIELIAADYLLKEIGKDQHAVQFANDPISKQASPRCPQCGATMLMKTARKGAHVGNTFWGCSNFPKCRRTRPAA